MGEGYGFLHASCPRSKRKTKIIEADDAPQAVIVMDKMETAMEHLSGMKAGMGAAKRKKSASKKKHEASKHSGKVKHLHIHRADDNSFIMEHQMEPEADGSQMPDTQHTAPDMDSLMDHVQQHLGEPNPGEAEASAPPPMPGAAT